MKQLEAAFGRLFCFAYVLLILARAYSIEYLGTAGTFHDVKTTSHADALLGGSSTAIVRWANQCKSRTGKTYEYTVQEDGLGDPDNRTIKFEMK